MPPVEERRRLGEREIQNGPDDAGIQGGQLHHAPDMAVVHASALGDLAQRFGLARLGHGEPAVAARFPSGRTTCVRLLLPTSTQPALQ